MKCHIQRVHLTCQWLKGLQQSSELSLDVNCFTDVDTAPGIVPYTSYKLDSLSVRPKCLPIKYVFIHSFKYAKIRQERQVWYNIL